MFNNIIAKAQSAPGVGIITSKLNQASPNVLFGAGLVGVLGTVVLSSRATLKSVDVLKEAADVAETIEAATLRDEYSDKDRVKDQTILYSRVAVDLTKLYLPALAVGFLSVACLTQSHRVLTQRNVALASAFAGVEKALESYRERVVAEIGPEREAKIWQPIEKIDVVDEDGKKSKIDIPTGVGGSPYKVCFDESNANWNRAWEYNRMFISSQEQFANDRLRAKGFLFLNDVRVALGFEPVPEGQVVGWVAGGKGDDYVDFGLFKNLAAGQRFVNGDDRSIWLDFNVDGYILDQI